ncbi:MAG: cytochrome b [Stappiaceae bacterium]
MKQPATAAYDVISRFNHWIIAFAIIGMLIFGVYIEDFVPRGPEKGALIGIHKAIGVLILIYGVWRIGWRLVQGFLEPAAPMPPWQDRISKITHWVLIAGILIMPISGMMTSLFGSHDISVFGIFTIPGLTENRTISDLAGSVHAIAGKVMIAFVVLHIAGALKHHLVDKDATLSRMTSGKANR